jgi:hypothetical protein
MSKFKFILLSLSQAFEKLHALVKKIKGIYEWLVAKLPPSQSIAKLYILIKIFKDIHEWLAQE